MVITDQFATGQSNFSEFLYGLAAQAGEGGNFDGNGQFLRIQPGGGPIAVSEPVPDGEPDAPDNVNYGNIDRRPDRDPAAEAGEGAADPHRRRLRHAGPVPT